IKSTLTIRPASGISVIPVSAAYTTDLPAALVRWENSNVAVSPDDSLSLENWGLAGWVSRGILRRSDHPTRPQPRERRRYAARRRTGIGKPAAAGQERTGREVYFSP